jgi:DNA-binding LacI/PurR family transcriptional regulator
MPTVHDVARLAGVSVSTVSYALSGARPITPATRERIERAMDELGYIPNALAQGLARRRSQIIALMFPTTDRSLNLTGLQCVLGAADRAQESGYHLLLWTSDDVDDLRRLVKQGLVDGVLVMEVRLDDERIGVLAEAGVSFTLIGRSGEHDPVDYVDADFAQMTRTAIEYLVGLGHTDFVFLNQSQSLIDVSYGPSARVASGVLAAAAEFGVSMTSFAVENDASAGRDLFARVIDEIPQTTAVVGFNDEAVVGMMAAAAYHGWAVPRDLSVVAIAMSDAAATLTMPTLTTCSPPHGLIGRAAVDVLIGRLQGDRESPLRRQLHDSALAVRSSSGPRRRHF